MTTFAHPPTSQLTPRGPVGLLLDRQFGTLFWGKIISVVGVWLHCLVAALVVFDATESALMVGLVGVAQFGPQLVLTPISGKWADRGNPVAQIILGRVLCAIGSGAIGVLLAVVGFDDPTQVTGAVLIGSLVVGLGFVVGGPAMQSIVPSLIRPGELPTAMALNSVPMTIGRVVGPLIGAFIVAHLGAVWAFAASAALSLIFAVAIALQHFPRPAPPRPGQDFRVRTALRYVWSDRPLLVALLGVATVGFATDPSITLAPSLAHEVGGGTHLVGQLSATFGVGAAAALLVLALIGGRISSATTSLAGLSLLTAGSALLTIAPGAVVALIGYGIAGLGLGTSMSGLSTVIQQRSPDELRGRIMALWMVGFVGSRPFAAAILGGSADLYSTGVAFGIAAVVALATTILFGLSMRRTGTGLAGAEKVT